MKRVIIVVLAGCVSESGPGPWQAPADAEIGPPPPAAPTKCTLRIASWNLHFAPDPEGLARAIAASSEIRTADVLFAQEVDAYPAEPGTRASRLATALGMTWVYDPARAQGSDGTHGLAILSRYPLANIEERQLPYVDQAIHPERRIALAADVVLPDDTVRVVDIHLDTRLGPADRVGQLDPAVDGAGDRLVAGGDLNTLPWTWVGGAVPLTEDDAVVGQEQAQIVDDFMTAIGFTGAIAPTAETFPVTGLTIRLDNLYTRSLPLVAAGVEHVPGSDHWPIWIDVDRCATASR